MDAASGRVKDLPARRYCAERRDTCVQVQKRPRARRAASRGRDTWVRLGWRGGVARRSVRLSDARGTPWHKKRAARAGKVPALGRRVSATSPTHDVAEIKGLQTPGSVPSSGKKCASHVEELNFVNFSRLRTISVGSRPPPGRRLSVAPTPKCFRPGQRRAGRESAGTQ
jgi:hypothetical protein